jgi:hypothetical protein
MKTIAPGPDGWTLDEALATRDVLLQQGLI